MRDVSSPEATTVRDEEKATRSLTAEALLSDLNGLSSDRSTPELHEEVRDVGRLVVEASERGLIESGVRDLRARDAAEAFVGSVIFTSPLLVEDGVFDIADHLFGVTVAGIPVFLVANTLFVVLITYALLEWTGRNTQETAVLFGVVPMRLLMTLTVSFLVATLLMTVWGRVGGWASPIQALAYINVIWTVGSLGAALGDILSDNDGGSGAPPSPNQDAGDQEGVPPIAPEDGWAQDHPDSIRAMSDIELVEALHTQFDELESAANESAHRREVHRLREETLGAAIDDAFGDTIEKYTSRDIAEAFVGSIVFSIPFLVEDGVFDVATFFLSFHLGLFPVFLLINAAFVLGVILGLVYWAGPQDVRVSRPIFGILPRRLVGIAVVSFLTGAALMTMWGRVDGWTDPVVALARVSVVWTVASFGAALGDILPGESSGADINDGLAALGDRGRNH